MALLSGGSAAAQPQDTTKRILELPPLQWDAMGVVWHPATQQTAGGLTRIMGGLRFGLKPEEVSRLLPKLGGTQHWADLPTAKEFSEDVRYIRMPMRAAGPQLAPVTACFGAPSNIVLLFRYETLFRISWRFLPDADCPDPRPAAEQEFAGYVPIAAALAKSIYYRTGAADVVDVTDPGTGPSLARRWNVGDP